MNILTLTSQDQARLSKLSAPPNELMYKGIDLPSLPNQYRVAIVGTRKPTPYGKEMTRHITETLVRAGVVIVSGLAFGIDSLAHSSAVAMGGVSIAVLPGGLDAIYPAAHEPLAQQILASGGTLISEYSAHHTPRKGEFHARNRIIAGLSDIVVIPEAALRSGSLNTASHAVKMGIRVVVVPGHVTSPMSAGTNSLLVSGRATAVTCGDDVVRLLGITAKTQTALSLEGSTPAESLLLQAMADGLQTPDELQAATGMSISDFLTTTTMLELSGLITQNSQGHWLLQRR